MRVALCHLNVICGPQTVNLCQLEQAIRMAAQQGAQWVLTPEMAVQGYHFLYLGQNQVMVPQPAPELRRLLDIVRAGRMYLFWGAGNGIRSGSKITIPAWSSAPTAGSADDTGR